jgi:predicted NAD/FAD-binding protein
VKPAPLRIGIIGGGVSGMAAAWLLQHDHRVTLIEKAPRLGGHAETVAVALGPTTVHADLGPRFFFDPSYPYFRALLRVLAVPIRWNDARVSITDVPRGRSIALPPRSPGHVAALLRSPGLARHLASLRRLIREQGAVIARRDFSVSLRAYLVEGRYPASFGPGFAYPFFAACWGAPLGAIPDFPAYSLLKGMPPGESAGFFEIEGGMGRYVDAFRDELAHVDVRLGAGVRRIARDDAFVVEDERGDGHRFDRLVVATSAREGAGLLRGVPGVGEMQAAVGGVRHFDVDIAIHGDASLMPPRREDWGHNNFFFDGPRAWMTDWQGLRAGAPVFRTWLPEGRRAPVPLHARRAFHHVRMTPEHAVLQRRIAGLQGVAGLWVAGMYAVDVDNHESALLSALVPARALAPGARNLERLLAAVAPGGAHGLDILPAPPSPMARRSVAAADEART